MKSIGEIETAQAPEASPISLLIYYRLRAIPGPVGNQIAQYLKILLSYTYIY